MSYLYFVYDNIFGYFISSFKILEKTCFSILKSKKRNKSKEVKVSCQKFARNPKKSVVFCPFL